MAVTAANQREWAKIGASARLFEIEKERATILSVFPGLRRRSASAQSDGPRKRRSMSAAARRRMSAGMRKYWAKRRAQAKSGSKAKAQE
jgi:hypothetical protein